MSSLDGEIIIGDHNYQQFLDDQHVDGENKARGLIPRNYDTHPLGCYGSIVPFYAVDMPTIPESEWPERIKEKNSTKSWLSDIRNSGNNGQPIPSLDQNGKGYCLPAGSPILMADGTHKPIEQVQLGDEVICSKLTRSRVARTYQRLFTGDMVRLKMEGTESAVILTQGHYIPTPSNNPKWPNACHDSEAKNFVAGAEVYTYNEDRTQLQKQKVRHVSKKPVKDLRVFDIGIEDEDHYFFTNGLMVHNCWAHSGTSCVLLLRAVNNAPYVDLSAYAIACIIKKYADQGGWGAQGLDFITSRGVPSGKYWPQQSMSRSNDNAETWANAALHKVTEGWVDLQAAQYDRNLSKLQVGTCLLCNIPVVFDMNFWSHSIAGMDLVDGNEQRSVTRVESGKLADLQMFEKIWGLNDYTGISTRIWNSWGNSWSKNGTGILSGSKAWPDGSVAPRVTIPSLV